VTTKEVLIAARKLIEDPKHWTQGWFARNAAGEKVPVISPDACKFCAIGALDRVERNTPVAFSAHRALCSALESPCDPVSQLNDCEGHVAVLALYDKAIASCVD
jgi:hypothetical protein